MTKAKSSPTIGRRPIGTTTGTTPPRSTANKPTATDSSESTPRATPSPEKKSAQVVSVIRQPGSGPAEKKSTLTRKNALKKTKRTTPDRTVPRAADVPPPTPAQAAIHDQVTADAQRAETRGLAQRFAAAVQMIGRGVTIGIDKNLKVYAIQHATEEEIDATRKGHGNDKAGVADGQDDPRMRDLDATVRQFVRGEDKVGTRAKARARFAAAVLGVRAANAAEVEKVADAALEGLRARLHNEAPKNDSLPPDEVTLLDDAAAAWKAISDTDFWTGMADAATPADGATRQGYLREQASWMGLVAQLSMKDHTVPWTWASAAEKADLVDELIRPAAGADNPARAVMLRLTTLTRGQDAFPRAIAAELAQLAIAALAGEKQAAPPDRAGVLKLQVRPPASTAADADKDAFTTREALRDVGQDLVGPNPPYPKFDADLFRDRLSRLYLDARELLRQHQPNPKDAKDRPGDVRYERLMAILGSRDMALIEGLDRWSETLASGSTDPADYLARARVVKAALDAWIDRLDVMSDELPMTDAYDDEPANDAGGAQPPPEPLVPVTGPERDVVGAAVRELAAEIGYQVGEVLLGHLSPGTGPAAGLRKGLQNIRAIESGLQKERVARLNGKLSAARIAKKLNATFKTKANPNVALPQWGKAVQTAAAALDVAADATKKTVDPADVATKVTALLAAVTQARTKAATLEEEKPRQGVVDVVDLVLAGAAEALARTRPPDGSPPDVFAADIARLRNAISLPTVPPPGKIASFWSSQKTAALAKLPSAAKKQVDAAMKLDLGAELGRLASIAAKGDAAATEEQGWRVIQILRVYRTAIEALPEEEAAVGRSRLYKALDGVGTAVERLLPTAPAPAVV
jgi:hypothetical protein